ncbi:MAG: YeeE/YedE family protein [Gammaproteobacteria bacterium]|nr:YeeE/YedE family protein [Gammaproteobacteria bacterium]
MHNLTLLNSLLGGMLIGLAAAVLWIFNGRIAGVSTIVSDAIDTSQDNRAWRWWFLIGLTVGATIYSLCDPRALTWHPVMSEMWLVVAGLLVGVGARMSNGCTSGHGVCGIAQLSRRSVLATITFILCGMLTVWVLRHGVTLL